MENLYYILHQPVSERIELTKKLAPELLSIVKWQRKESITYSNLSGEIISMFGEPALQEFINLQTDKEKLQMIDQSSIHFPICLPTQLVLDHLTSENYKRHLFNSVVCGDQEVFSYIIGNFRMDHSTSGYYFDVLSYNPSVINLFSTFYSALEPNTKRSIIVFFCRRMRKHPNLVIYAKYIFDFIMDRTGLEPEQLAEILIDGAKMGGGTPAQRNIFTACEILNQTGYFSHDFFVNLAERYSAAKEWLDVNDADV